MFMYFIVRIYLLVAQYLSEDSAERSKLTKTNSETCHLIVTPMSSPMSQWREETPVRQSNATMSQ
jgi:hypothetical protein